MPRSFLSILFASLLVSAQMPTSSPPASPKSSVAIEAPVLTAEQEFDRAALKHTKDLGTLMKSRGLPAPALQRVDHKSVTALLCRAYQPGTAALVYSYADGSLGIWLVSCEGIVAYTQISISQQDLENLAARASASIVKREEWEKRAPVKRGFAVSTPDSREFKPIPLLQVAETVLPRAIAARLAGVRRLIVVPVLNLAVIPYSLLPVPQSTTVLADMMSVSVSPSLFDLAFRNESDTRAALQGPPGKIANGGLDPWKFRNPLVIGNPAFGDSDWTLPALPGAEAEAAAVAKMIGSTPITGKAANKDVLRNIQRFDLLYFATHGVADPQNPIDGSFIALTGNGPEQSRWSAREIQRTQVHARLVVLSACQTGLGGTQDAGVTGLARAFQVAGADWVVMSLWSVDDHATAELMTSFMAVLTTCNSYDSCLPTEALRVAMLKTREKYPDPRAWGAWTVFGSPKWEGDY